MSVVGGHTRDAEFMSHAIALARDMEGLTRPNPPVGAILVDAQGTILGEGAHQKAGTPHAEIHAIRDAERRGAALDNATLYVTLEPCSTHGRTPPCTDAILKTGIRRVVIGATDPNPAHSGRGIHILQQAGISVTTDVCVEDAQELIAPFRTYILEERPFFTLKLGTSLDGRIADRDYHSRWITGAEARTVVQALRRKADAIMVGAGTVRHDNPSLWPRPDEGRMPYRIIVAQQGGLPLDAQVFTDEHLTQTIVAAPDGWKPDIKNILINRGIMVLALPEMNFWRELAGQLRGMGLLRVFCEGGGRLAESLVKAGLVDEVHWFFSPKLLGGPVGAMGGSGWTLPEAPSFKLKQLAQCGADIHAHFLPGVASD